MEMVKNLYGTELGMTGGRVWQYQIDNYTLKYQIGTPQLPEGFELPLHNGGLKNFLKDGIAFSEEDDDNLKKYGIRLFSAIALDENNYLISWTLNNCERKDVALNTLKKIQRVTNLFIGKTHVDNHVHEAIALQKGMISSPNPEFEGYEIWGECIPAREVGGDLFYHSISDNRLNLVVADARGHDFGATMLATRLHTALDMSIDSGHGYVHLLKTLNNNITRVTPDYDFITLFLASLQSSGVMHYSNVGHNPAFIVNGEKYVELPSINLPLGISEDADFTTDFFRLEKGDVLTIYTDGIVEKPNGQSGKMYGKTRLANLVNENRHKSAQEINMIVLTDVCNYAGMTPERDDITLAIVKKL